MGVWGCSVWCGVGGDSPLHACICMQGQIKTLAITPSVPRSRGGHGRSVAHDGGKSTLEKQWAAVLSSQWATVLSSQWTAVLLWPSHGCQPGPLTEANRTLLRRSTGPSHGCHPGPLPEATRFLSILPFFFFADNTNMWGKTGQGEKPVPQVWFLSVWPALPGLHRVISVKGPGGGPWLGWFYRGGMTRGQ